MFWLRCNRAVNLLPHFLNTKQLVPWTARRSVHPKGNQSWIFSGRTDAEAETPILWPPDVKSRLIWKDPDAGKDWRREEKGTTEDEIVGWHHRLSGHGFRWTPGVGDGQGSLVCCSLWGHRESDMTEWTEPWKTIAGAFHGYVQRESHSLVMWFIIKGWGGKHEF